MDGNDFVGAVEVVGCKVWRKMFVVKVEIMRSSLPYQLVFMVDLKNVWVESGWK